MLSYDIARCAGKYDNLHGEFGAVINKECLKCQRRALEYAGGYQPVPEFEAICPNKIINQEGN